MVDVSSQSNKVNITVSSSGVSSNVNASSDTTMYYSNKAKEWAISERLVDGKDYSSKYYAEKSNQSALNAQSFAQSAQDSYNNVQNSAVKALEDIEEDKTNAISEINTTKTSAINNITTAKNSAISDIDTTAKNYDNLTYRQITNCLLEVPQNIKLELNNGTLTLKAGSKVIVPNGAGVFDEQIVSSDVVIGSRTGTGVLLLSVRKSSNAVDTTFIGNCLSGASLTPATASLHYDTANNIIHRYSSSVDTYFESSLPIALIKLTDGVYTSIDQVFNGFGYIGSTVFALPGVKGLIPNGRNADGSLKNIEVTTSKVSIHTLTSTNDRYVVLFASGNIDEPSGLVYSEAENRNYNYADICNACDCGTVKRNSNGVITSLDIKQAFRAVDYADYKPAIDSKVSKSGDIMTGKLTIQAGGMDLVHHNVTKGTTPASTAYQGIRFNDKNSNTAESYTDTRLGLIESVVSSDGKVRLVLLAYKNAASTTSAAGVYIDIDANGINYFDFPKCTTKATTTSSAKTNKVAVVTQNYVNGTSWYRVWSDGWIEQGGVANVSGTTQTTINLLKAFSNTNYTVTYANGYDSVPSGSHITNLGTKKTNSFVRYGSNSWTTFNWYACGY